MESSSYIKSTSFYGYFIVSFVNITLAILIGLLTEKLMRLIQFNPIVKVIIHIVLIVTVIWLINFLIFDYVYQRFDIKISIGSTIFFISVFLTMQVSLFNSLHDMLHVKK